MKIGFIGAGNMATAIIEGIINAKFVDCKDIFVNAKFEDEMKRLADKYFINICYEKKELIEKVDIIILAVKPNQYVEVVENIKDYCKENQLIISIAAGLTINNIEKMFGMNVKLIRCMPNTPVTVREGMTGICGNKNVESDDINYALKLFSTIGKAEVINEKQMDAVVAVSGSSPAYVYMMIDAMIEGAIIEGMEKEKARLFAAQAVLGSAKMILETDIEPSELKNRVCSPGGTTIEAVKVLEQKEFCSSIIDAMKACADKSRNM